MRLQIDRLGKVAITIEKDYWNINKDYDKLVIVEIKDIFATYISRKPVPAGTVITDRNYWIPFSSLKESIVINYNEFKDKYDKQIQEINKTLLSNVLKIQELVDAVKELQDIKKDLMFTSIGDGLEIDNKVLNVKVISEGELQIILNK